MYLTPLLGKRIALTLTCIIVFQMNIESTVINTKKFYFKAVTAFTGILVIIFFFNNILSLLFFFIVVKYA